MKSIRVAANHLDGYTVIIGYLIDEENAIVFENNQVWLTRVKETDNDLYESITNMSLLGKIPKFNYSLEDYLKRLVKHLKNTSMFSYIVQKHFYDDQDINFNITNI
ncbi:hypothetical protein V7266_29030 [Neobacillus drentensis]|uniref:hypothetical protein n=1 Tax=Neobacillus drentensis TaxID=220684 RepID=UPI002FFF5281